MKLKKNCHWKKIILKSHKKSRDIWLFWSDSVKWIEKSFANLKIEHCNFWFAINSCLNVQIKMYFLNESLIRLKISRKFWSNCITKTNIKVKKIFIDAWQTNIDDAIYIKIVKNMSLTVTFVSVKSSTKRKKYCILHECWHLLKRSA